MDEIFVLVLAIVAFIFAVPYALAILLYTFPLFIVWQILPVRIKPEPQLIVDVSSYPELAKLRAERQNAKDRYKEIRYNDWGIRWSDNLGRFEERSVHGRELNEQLAIWSDEIERVSCEIREAERPEADVFAQWSTELRYWNQKRARIAAKQFSWKSALPAFVGVWIVGELVGQAFPGVSKFFAFAWNPAPEYLHPGLALGALAGWGAALYPILNPPKSFSRLAQAKINENWDATMARAQAADLEFAASSDRATQDDHGAAEDEYEGEQDESDEVWHEILGVSAEATAAEIKKAYREKIQQYHPDRVSGLGEKLQLLAKLETQKLNAAREAGMSLRK